MPPAQTVIVTGAGGGLGKAIAEAFLASGARVAVCDVNAGRLRATEAEWTAAGRGAETFLAAEADVTDEASVRAFVAAAIAKFGRLDVLVNNAGIMDDFSPVGGCSRELWDRVMGVNVLGPYHMMRAALEHFQPEGEGAAEGAAAGTGGGLLIINICSVAARSGHHAGAAYTASKHALLGLSRNTAFAYAPRGVCSVALLLGGMHTNIADAMRGPGGIDTELFARQQAAHTPMDPARHLVAVETVARYAVFVAGDRAVARGLNGSAVDLTNNWPEA